MVDLKERTERFDRLRTALSNVIRGKSEAIDLLIVGILARGHVLIEDVPGVGKTTLAKALARAFSLDFTRVQFTPDLLPSDILGSQVLYPKEGRFEFRQGPIFANILLADEINRASPRTQSALLEAMNENQVSVDGTTHPLPDPFFVVATQNPVDFQGTYPLPEAQLDRFLLQFDIGYPPAEEELEILYARQKGDPLDVVQPVLDGPALLELQAEVRAVEVKRPVADYLRRIVTASRNRSELALGVSPRGTLALFRAVQARALLDGRDFVTPEDVQALAGPTLAHRVLLAPSAKYGGTSPAMIIEEIVRATDVPK